MALFVLSVVISQATGGAMSCAISLLLGYKPEHAIKQHRGIHQCPTLSPLCDLYFLRKQKMKWNCLNSNKASNSHERFLGGTPMKHTVALSLLCSD